MHSHKHLNIVAIFNNGKTLGDAVDRLRERGIRNSALSVLFPDDGQGTHHSHARETKAPEASAAGASTGAVAGGLFGWFAGTGAIAIPGVGPFIAAGPILGMLAGMGAGGAAGGLIGAFLGLGIPEAHARRYEGLVKEGGLLLTVHLEEAVIGDEVMDLIRSCGAQEVSMSEESPTFNELMGEPSRMGESDSAITTGEEKKKSSEFFGSSDHALDKYSAEDASMGKLPEGEFAKNKERRQKEKLMRQDRHSSQNPG
jgi:hypothetical protein